MDSLSVDDRPKKRVVYQDSLGCQLIFDDWQWFYAERDREAGERVQAALTLLAADSGFLQRFSFLGNGQGMGMPRELEFQLSHPEPFLVWSKDQTTCRQFDPRGWELLCKNQFNREWDGYQFVWSGTEWLFRGGGTFLVVSFPRHAEGGCAGNPEFWFLSASAAADFLAEAGVPLPEDLLGCGTIQALRPDTVKSVANKSGDTASTGTTPVPAMRPQAKAEIDDAEPMRASDEGQLSAGHQAPVDTSFVEATTERSIGLLPDDVEFLAQAVQCNAVDGECVSSHMIEHLASGKERTTCPRTRRARLKAAGFIKSCGNKGITVLPAGVEYVNRRE